MAPFLILDFAVAGLEARIPPTAQGFVLQVGQKCSCLPAGRQMQVELCEIPLAGAPETLRSEAYSTVRRNDACAPKRFSAQATKDEPACR